MNYAKASRRRVTLVTQFRDTLITCSIVLLILLSCAMSAVAQGSGLNSTEGAVIPSCAGGSSCGSVVTDTLWADSTVHRWRMLNDTASTSSPLVVAQWACSVSPGCIMYSASTASSSVYPETALSIGGQGSFLQVNSSLLPNWSTSPTLGQNGSGGATGQLNLANGTSGGASIGLENTSATTAYNFIFPASAGTAGNVFLSGGGTGANTWTGYTIPSSATNGGLLYANSASTTAFSATPTLGVQNTTVGGLTLAGSSSAGASITLTGTGSGSPGTSTIAVTAAGTTLELGSTNAEVNGSGDFTAGTWQGTTIGAGYGGTGINNGSNTLTLGASLATTGTGAPTLAFPATTSYTYTYPANTGTLGELGFAQTWSALQTFGTEISIGGVQPSGATGTGNLAFSASPTFTGTLTATTVAATTIDGAALSGTFTGAPTLSGSVSFTGAPTATTATAGTNTTQIASTAFVSTAISNLGCTSGCSFAVTQETYTVPNTSGATVSAEVVYASRFFNQTPKEPLSNHQFRRRQEFQTGPGQKFACIASDLTGTRYSRGFQRHYPLATASRLRCRYRFTSAKLAHSR